MHRHALVQMRLIRCGVNGTIELAGAERIDGVLSGEQPAAFAYLALCVGNPPPMAQLFEQDGREHGVTILAALALFDAQRHALAVDIADLECAYLAHAQSCTVGDGQRRLVFEIAGGGEQTRHLVATQHHRQFVGNAYRLHLAHQFGAVERVLEQELQAAERIVDRDCRRALVDHIQLVVSQIIHRRGVWGSLQVRRELPH